jgi:hypothetical protein
MRDRKKNEIKGNLVKLILVCVGQEFQVLCWALLNSWLIPGYRSTRDTTSARY